MRWFGAGLNGCSWLGDLLRVASVRKGLPRERVCVKGFRFLAEVVPVVCRCFFVMNTHT